MKKVAMMKNVRSLTLVLAGLMLLLSASVVLAVAAEQPNIIILFADDLGYGELSCQGNPEIPTPHIDSIASNGVRFTDGYVAGPNCSPSRAGLLTGRTPTRFGYEFNPTGALNEDPGFGLPIEEVTIAEALHDAGYTTGLIGKWHQGGTAKYHPFRHGDWKLVHMGKGFESGNAKWELYDLSKDISEETNLAKANPETLAELVSLWEQMNSEMSDPLF